MTAAAKRERRTRVHNVDRTTAEAELQRFLEVERRRDEQTARTLDWLLQNDEANFTRWAVKILADGGCRSFY